MEDYYRLLVELMLKFLELYLFLFLPQKLLPT
jgi:hypothetical protein